MRAALGHLRDLVLSRDAVGLLGVALLTEGARRVYPPAAFITPGVICLAVAIVGAWREGSREARR